MADRDTSRTPRDSLRITSVEPAGWEPSAGRLPKVGEHVYCTDGPAKVVRLLGKTSDGSRLLELRCADSTHSFFASSSNVLIRTPTHEETGFLDEATAIGGG